MPGRCLPDCPPLVLPSRPLQLDQPPQVQVTHLVLSEINPVQRVDRPPIQHGFPHHQDTPRPVHHLVRQDPPPAQLHHIVHVHAQRLRCPVAGQPARPLGVRRHPSPLAADPDCSYAPSQRRPDLHITQQPDMLAQELLLLWQPTVGMAYPAEVLLQDRHNPHPPRLQHCRGNPRPQARLPRHRLDQPLHLSIHRSSSSAAPPPGSRRTSSRSPSNAAGRLRTFPSLPGPPPSTVAPALIGAAYPTSTAAAF